MSETKQFFINVEGQRVPVTEQVYFEYYRSKRRDRYYEKDIKIERAARNKNGNIIGYKPAKEDSLQRLMENGEDYVDENASVEDSVFNTFMLDKLNEALRLLENEERKLIHALFFKKMTERECAEKFGISKTAIHARKMRIFDKLRNLLEKDFQNS